ncbi:hypothetical protein B0H67DRAFT_28505 [Lasiosphaeris hirsuta]|uniref:Uncharacterized protein n=1 Tax=Lasiosphaeris hirsuta TaxID=260670 RepID=A0AA40BA15_9PEZI|nr:hypothetical protein B0H67DRAFT_28505 [Lasiosphaeris hirsuta]
MSGRLPHAAADPRNERYEYGGYYYHRGTCCSEQPPVIKVTSKLGRAKNFSQVDLREKDLLGLVHIYVRIYMCPEVARKRLELWYESHKTLVANWGIIARQFWNNEEQDEMCVPYPPSDVSS